MNFIRTTMALIVLGMTGLTWAQSTTDFSGTWVLNTDKGENLGMVAAIQETLVVTQSAEQLSVAFTDVFRGKTSTRQVTYDLGGKPVENYAAMGDRSETISRWVDNQLVTTWTSEGAIAGTEVVRTETRAVSDDGSTLTVTSARGNNPPMIMVYEKQE